MELSERKKRILRAVVENYIQTAEPVGSKTVMDSAGLEVSSATIRNEMADLESMGLLEQPHTSAGRIPSLSGYRFYVSELMEEHRLSLQETQSLNEALHLKMQELDRVVTEAGKVVSQLTRLPAFALTTGGEMVTISRFDLLMVGRDCFIAVIMTSNQTVRNKLFRLPDDLSKTQLELLSTLLNSSFTGLTLVQLETELNRVSAYAAGGTCELINLVVSFAMEVLREMEGHVVHTSGIANLLAHPEYQNLSQAEPLLNFLSEPEECMGCLIPRAEHVQILVGPENVAKELKNSSVVMASYDIGEGMRGVIGVVGPPRMDYATLAARLSYFADGLSRMFGKGELPPSGETDPEATKGG